MGERENISAGPACGLAEEIIRTFGEVRLRVYGTSMAPCILPGDLVSIERASLRDISPGEIVLYFRNGRLFVHRVVERKAAATAGGSGEPCLITRGDRLSYDDPPVCSAELLGRVVSVERANRKVELRGMESNHPIVRLLRASDRVTYLYVRLAASWRTLFPRRAKCQA